MNTEIVRVKGGYNFTKAHAEAQKHLAYYEEGLFIDVAARVIDAMEARGVTRSDLARRMEVSPAYITKVLRGHANLSLESLAKLAFALNLKWECILVPKAAQVGAFSLINEFGDPTICTVKTAVIKTFAETITSSESEYDLNVEEQYYESRIPA
ncbi:MAG: helix-turn-helix transcriptional regulator [Patescibacteria group bacterium]